MRGDPALPVDMLVRGGWTGVTDPLRGHDAVLVGGGLVTLTDARRLSPAPLLLVPPPDFGSRDRARALAAGADDVAPQPCDPAELLARLDALCRRRSYVPGALLCGDLAIDPVRRSASRAGRPIALLPREYALLHHLADQAGSVVSRSALLDKVWNLRFDPNTNVVEVHVSRLRAKLDRGFPTRLLHTVKGRGYALAERPPLD